MVEAVTLDFNPDWRSRSPYAAKESDSEAELEDFLKECQELLLVDNPLQGSKKRYEYVVSGIFHDPSIDVASDDGSEQVYGDGKVSSNEDAALSDPIYSSALYNEFLDTLSYLMETQRIEVYEQITFSRNSAARSKAALNFTSTDKVEQSKSLDVYVYKGANSQQQRCMLRRLDHDKIHAGNGDIAVRNLVTSVSNDIYTALHLYGYKITKRLYTCGHVFTNNFGNSHHIEIAVYRHYLDCDPKTPVSPKSLLVEVRCIGEGDVEAYRNLLRDYTKLLYKYVSFPLE